MEEIFVRSRVFCFCFVIIAQLMIFLYLYLHQSHVIDVKKYCFVGNMPLSFGWFCQKVVVLMECFVLLTCTFKVVSNLESLQ